MNPTVVQQNLVGKAPQRQDSLTDQLNDVITMANKMGCYDAADFIKNALEKPIRERKLERERIRLGCFL